MTSDVEVAVRDSAPEASSFVKWLARLGMFCAGVLWIAVGLLAIQVALGTGGETTDKTGALHEIAEQPAGTALLVVLAIGFAGYALWRFVAGALGRKLETNEDLSWPKRLWYVARGIFYAFLCYTTISILVGSRSSSG
jgi:Mn2+/Fe2+ NRAMP family transporter